MKRNRIIIIFGKLRVPDFYEYLFCISAHNVVNIHFLATNYTFNEYTIKMQKNPFKWTIAIEYKSRL